MADITKKDIEVALARPSDFAVHIRDVPLFETWSLGPVIKTRDSNNLELSNHDMLIKHLEENHPELEDDYQVTGCNHWAVGWVDHLSFKVINEDDGSPTKIFHVVRDWFDALSDYPVADESDLSEKEYESSIANISYIGYHFSNGKDGWEQEVYNWLSEHEPEELETHDYQGAWPSEESVYRALVKLNLLDEDESE